MKLSKKIAVMVATLALAATTMLVQVQAEAKWTKVAGGDASIVYSGFEKWTEGDYVEMYTRNPGDTATFTFDGTGIKVYSKVGSTFGMMEISIDGKVEKTVDLYAEADAVETLVFEKTGLTNGKHTLVVKNSDKKNDGSAETKANVNYLEYTADDAAAPATTETPKTEEAPAKAENPKTGDVGALGSIAVAALSMTTMLVARKRK